MWLHSCWLCPGRSSTDKAAAQQGHSHSLCSPFEAEESGQGTGIWLSHPSSSAGVAAGGLRHTKALPAQGPAWPLTVAGFLSLAELTP